MTPRVTASTTVTSIANGTGTGYTDQITGTLLEIRYTKVDYAAGVDFTITAEDSGQGLWTEADVNASTMRRPMAAVHDITGVARYYNDGGDEPVVAPIRLIGERVKIVLAQAGDTKSGSFVVVYED